MPAQVSKSQFNARVLEFLRKVETTGEPLIITHHGKPTLEIRKFEATKIEALEALKGSLLWYDGPLDPVDEGDWESLK
jgi:antitoxin (DNA-binding transcriptional repressor) of toxin-antitoxin stability system